MTQTKSIITCHVDGISFDPEPSIHRESFKRLEMMGSAIKILLSAYGNYGIDHHPQFFSGGVLLAVVPTHSEAPPFNAEAFDLYARNIAEFIDANQECRTPHLTHADHGLSINCIEDVCRSLRGCGTIVFQVDTMAAIEIRNRKKWRRSDDAGHIAVEVERATVVAGLKHSRGELIVSEDKAKDHHRGDLISSKGPNGATPVQRVVAFLVRMLDGNEALTIDMFDPDRPDER